MTPDERLHRELSEGSHAAFGEIFDGYADYVFNVAFRRTASEVVSEEIVSDVFAELWRQRNRITTRHGSLRPWLAGTAANLSRRHWRSSGRERRALLRLQIRSEATTPDESDSVIERLDETRRFDRLHRALSELSPEQFDVVTLSVWEQLSHEDIADALGVAVGTVKSRLSRARQRIESALGTDSTDRAWLCDTPSGVVGESPTVGADGGCT